MAELRLLIDFGWSGDHPITPTQVMSRGPAGPLFMFGHCLVRTSFYKTCGTWGSALVAGHEGWRGCGEVPVNVLLCIDVSGQMPQRPGAFAAQFAPETLQRFKDLCRQQDKAYSKVLERLALLYVETDGGILSSASSTASAPSKGVQKRQVQVESLQNKLLEDLLKRVEILEKKETKTLYELDRVYKEIAFLKSGLQSPE